MKKILTDSYTRFKTQLGPVFGVYERPNYTHERTKNFDIVLQLCPGLIPAPIPLTRMPFQGHTDPGFEYRTLLIEPPVFLARLECDLRDRGVTFVDRHFVNRADVLTSLSQNIIVNCTGMGAKELFNDTAMQPIKGQLAMLPAQQNLKYLYSGDGYLFPRSDHVVIGGTYEPDLTDETPSAERLQGRREVHGVALRSGACRADAARSTSTIPTTLQSTIRCSPTTRRSRA